MKKIRDIFEIDMEKAFQYDAYRPLQWWELVVTTGVI